MSDVLRKSLEELRQKVLSTTPTETVIVTDIASLLSALSPLDQAVLKGIAGDNSLTFGEVIRALGQQPIVQPTPTPGPIVTPTPTPVPPTGGQTGMSDVLRKSLEELRQKVPSTTPTETVIVSDITSLFSALSPADQGVLKGIAGDNSLTLGEVIRALGQQPGVQPTPTPIPGTGLSTALQKVIDTLRQQFATNPNTASISITTFLNGLTQQEQDLLKSFAGSDSLITLTEIAVALGQQPGVQPTPGPTPTPTPGPQLSAALQKVIDTLRQQFASNTGIPSISISTFLGGLSQQDQDLLKAFAGPDNLITLTEIAVALGQQPGVQPTPTPTPGPGTQVSAALQQVIHTLRQQFESNTATTSISISTFLGGLSQQDQDLLKKWAGSDSLITLAEIVQAVGQPPQTGTQISAALQKVVDAIRQQLTAAPTTAIDITSFLSQLTDPNDQTMLKSFAGTDGKITLAELTAVIGGITPSGPQISAALQKVIDTIRQQLGTTPGAAVDIAGFLSQLTDANDQTMLKSFAGADGKITLAELTAAFPGSVQPPVSTTDITFEGTFLNGILKFDLTLPSPVGRISTEARISADGKTLDGTAATPTGSIKATFSRLEGTGADNVNGRWAGTIVGQSLEVQLTQQGTQVRGTARIQSGQPGQGLQISAALQKVIDSIRQQLGTTPSALIDIAGFMSQLTDANDQTMLKSFAGTDGKITLAELTAVIGGTTPSGPQISAALQKVIDTIRQQLTAAPTTAIDVSSFLSQLTDANDQTMLKSFAGADGKLTLAELTAAFPGSVQPPVSTTDITFEGTFLNGILKFDLTLPSPVGRISTEARISADGKMLDGTAATPTGSIKATFSRLEGTGADNVNGRWAGTIVGQSLEVQLTQQGTQVKGIARIQSGQPGQGLQISAALQKVIDAIRQQLGTTPSALVDIAGFLTQLTDPNDQSLLKSFAGTDGKLTLDELSRALQGGVTPPVSGNEPIVRGKVTKLDPAGSSFTVEVATNQIETVLVQTTTAFFIQTPGGAAQPPVDQPAKVGDLKVGDQVLVYGKRDEVKKAIVAEQVVTVPSGQVQPPAGGTTDVSFEGTFLNGLVKFDLSMPSPTGRIAVEARIAADGLSADVKATTSTGTSSQTTFQRKEGKGADNVTGLWSGMLQGIQFDIRFDQQGTVVKGYARFPSGQVTPGTQISAALQKVIDAIRQRIGTNATLALDITEFVNQLTDTKDKDALKQASGTDGKLTLDELNKAYPGQGVPVQPVAAGPLFQGRVVSVDQATKKSIKVQPDFGGQPVEVLVSEKTLYEGRQAGVTTTTPESKKFEDIKVDSQVEVFGQRQGTQVVANRIAIFTVEKINIVGKVVFVDMGQGNILLEGPSYQVSTETKFTGYKSDTDIQAGDIVAVTFGAPTTPGGSAPTVAIELLGKKFIAGQTTQPNTPRLEEENVTTLAQTTQPGPTTQTPPQFKFQGEVRKYDPGKKVLEIQGLFLHAEPNAVLVDESGRTTSLQDIQRRLAEGQVVALRVEAEQRGTGPLQIVKAGAVDAAELYASADIPGAQAGPFTLKTAAFDATPQPIQLANAVNVPLTATLKVEFSRKLAAGILNDRAFIVVVPKPDEIKPSIQSGILVLSAKLKANTAYTAFIGLDGLDKPILARFTTGAALPIGAVSGKVLLPAVKDLPLPPNVPADLLTGLKLSAVDDGMWWVLLVNKDPATLRNVPEDQLIAAVVGAQLLAAADQGAFKISAVPTGKYYLAALVDLKLTKADGTPPPANVQGLLAGIRLNFFTPYSKTAGSDTGDLIDVASAEVTGLNIQLGFPTPISVVEVTPKDNAASVPLETTVSVKFSAEPFHSGNALSVDMVLFPDPLSGQLSPGMLKLEGTTVSAQVKLQANTAYQLVVRRADSQGRPSMREPFKSTFTTGAKLGTGSVAGKLLPPPNVDFDRQASVGFVGLLPADIDLKRLTPADLPRFSVATDQTQGSAYRIKNAPAGSYILFATVDLSQTQNVGPTPASGGVGGQPAISSGQTGFADMPGESLTVLAQTVQPVPVAVNPAPTFVTGFYDKDKNGQPDVIQIKDGDPPLVNMDIQTGTVITIKQAPRALTVTSTSPKDGETSVKLQTDLSVTFSEALAAGQRYVPVDLDMIPRPDNFDPKKLKVKDEGLTAVLSVTLKQNTTYKLVIRGAVGKTGAVLTDAAEVAFSTGATQLTSGSLTGTVALSDKSTPVGSVKLIDADPTEGAAAKKVEIRASSDLTRTGDYLITKVVPNRSFLAFVEVDLGEAGVMQVFYDKSGDGKADVLTLKEGETLKDINFTVTVPTKVIGPAVPGPNTGATVSLDLNPAQGNQGDVDLAGLGTNARVDLAVYVKGVKDLTGFLVMADFDTSALAFDGAEPTTSKEDNLLNASGGKSLFLPPKLEMEYAGSLLGATSSATAPDGDGLLAVLHFVTTRNFTAETAISVPAVILKGINSQGKVVTDTLHLGGKVTIAPLTATTQKLDLNVLPTEVEGKVNVDLIDKSGTSLGRKLEQVAAGDTITVNILAREGATGITGFTARMEFPPDQVAYVDKSFTAGSMMPGLTALAKSGTGFVEVGGAAIAAFGGTASTKDSGVLGTVRFAIQPNYSGGTFIALTSASYQLGTFREDFDLYTLLLLGKIETPAPPSGGTPTPRPGNGTAMLDLDTSSDDQKVQIKNGVKGGQRVDVQILLGKSYSNASGFQVVLKFDAAKVKVVGWKKDGESFASAIDLPAQTKADSVTYGASIFGGSTTATGSLAVLTFETLSDYTGDTEIMLSTVQVRIAGGSPIPLKPGASVVLSSSTGVVEPSKPTPDFTGDGEVGFDDFFEFAAAFGQPATGANAKFDLDGDGEIGFGDFFEFAGAFGTTVSKKKPALSKPSGLGSLGANGEARLGLQVQPSDRQDAVTVDLSVSGARSLSGYGVDLEYDPSELEFVGSQPAGVFEAGAEGRPLLRSSDGLGRVHLADALAGEGVSGDGALTRLTFRIRPGGGIGSLRIADGLLLDPAGLTNRVAGAGLDGTPVPISYGLSQNYPNPFNPVTQIAYQVPEAGRVRLVVYNILGQRVRTLVDSPVTAGFYRSTWDGRDESGRSVSSGLYLYRMEAGKFSQVHKMLLLK